MSVSVFFVITDDSIVFIKKKRQLKEALKKFVWTLSFVFYIAILLKKCLKMSSSTQLSASGLEIVLRLPELAAHLSSWKQVF